MKFQELSEKAKDRAIHDYSESLANENFWWEYIAEELFRDLNDVYGLEVDDKALSFSLAYSQGDDATITIKDILNNKLLVASGLKPANQLVHEIEGLDELPEHIKQEVIETFIDQLTTNVAIHGTVGVCSPHGLSATSYVESEIEYIVDVEEVPEELAHKIVNSTEKLMIMVERTVSIALYMRMNDFYHQLANDWLDITSEAHIAEEAEANGWEFDESGDLISAHYSF